MKKHSDKGRYFIAVAIFSSNKYSPQLQTLALECILAYTPQ